MNRNQRKKPIRMLSSILLAVVVAASMGLTAFAQDTSVTYDGNAQDFICSTGSSGAPEDLFPNFKNVMPGDTVTQKITIKNDVDKNVKVKLYLRSLGAQAGSDEFLSKLRLSVKQDGNSDLFLAAPDQTAGLSDWTCLGTFYSGAEINLDMVLKVPATLGNEFRDASGTVRWQFQVEELPVSENDPKPPQTGDSNFMWLYWALIPAAGLGLTLCLLFVIRRKKEREQEELPADTQTPDNK